MELELRNKPLQSGVSYTLFDFFGPKRTIVIPDLQRDYCWASAKSQTEEKSLVEAYVDDLITASESNVSNKMKMGLLYGYEYPADNVQLCDGQQRLTTLFLIVGVCRNMIGDNYSRLKDEADAVLVNKNSSRLQYAIRDSSLSFINNLIENKAYYPEVEDRPWFSNEYRRDPSVCNMVEAIKQIYSKVTSAEIAENLLNYILHHISFLYFDMQSRTYSEEQYVILNTTGYSLTPTEHIKPRLLGKLNNAHELDAYSELWESWEQFLWEHRPKEDDNFTVDDWLDRFLTIFYLAENAGLDAPYYDKAMEYTTYQRVLQGKRKYNFPSDTDTSAKQSIDIINKYFETAKLIDELGLPVTLELGYEYIPSKSIWEYIARNDYWNNLSNLQQAVSLFIQLSRNLDATPEIITSWSNRVLEFAWVQSRYKKENQDVSRFLSFISEIELYGDSIYSVASTNSIFSAGLQNKKFPLVANIKNDSPISDMEKALQQLAHLHTSQGRISYALDALEELNPESIALLAHNLAQTTDAPDTLLRRALMTYGAYWRENGRCNWGKRYDFAPDARYFYTQTHDKQNEVIQDFVSDISGRTNVKEYLNNRIKTLTPTPTGDDRLDNIIQLLFQHKEYFDYMRYGRIAIDNHLAYAMPGLNATGNYLTIMDPRQRSLVNDTKKMCGEDWVVWDQFTIARQRKDLTQHKIWASGDWHISQDGKPEFRSYIHAECTDAEWPVIRSVLTKSFPDYYLDDTNKYLHLKVLHDATSEEAAAWLQVIFDTLQSIETDCI